MKRRIFVIICLAIGIAGGLWGYLSYFEDPENKITRIAKDTSAGVSKILLSEIEDAIDNSKITYRELFGALETHHTDITVRISELQKIRDLNIVPKTKIDAVIKYQHANLKFLSAEYDKYLKLFEFTNAAQSVNIQESFIAGYGNVNTAKIEFEKANEELVTALKELSDARSTTAEFMMKEYLVDKQIIDKVINKYQKE